MAVWMQTKSLYSETNYCLENNRRAKSLKTSTLKGRKQETDETKDSRLRCDKEERRRRLFCLGPLWKPEIVLITPSTVSVTSLSSSFPPLVSSRLLRDDATLLLLDVPPRTLFADEKWFYIAHCDPGGDVKDVVLMKVPFFFLIMNGEEEEKKNVQEPTERRRRWKGALMEALV